MKEKLASKSLEVVQSHLRESIDTKTALLDMAEPIAAACDLLVKQMRAGHKALLFGNGGSAADAQHIAAELVGRLEREHGCLPAIALTTDSSILTSVANDFGYDQIFSRQVKALARPGDVAVAISTSGNSPNVVLAAAEARDRGAFVIGLVGNSGGKLAEHCHHLIRVPSTRVMRIQECHIAIGHILCYAVEQAFLTP